MIKVNHSKWEIYDPDNILSYDIEEFDPNSLQFGSDIHPREDMMYFTHKKSNYSIDFGYYGCEIKLDGSYTIYVIDNNLEEPWHSPLEKHKSKSFIEGIKNIQALLTKYT